MPLLFRRGSIRPEQELNYDPGWKRSQLEGGLFLEECWAGTGVEEGAVRVLGRGPGRLGS